MANQFEERQNSQQALRFARAFRQGHNEAKRALLWQLILSASAVVFAFIADHWLPGAKPAVALGSLLFIVTDAAFVDAWAKSRQQTAALIQEEFDSFVLGIQWTKRVRPEPEEVDDLADAYSKKSSDDALKDWYPNVVGRLQLDRARLICQRTNLARDQDLRKGLWALYLFGIIAATFMLLAWALAKNLPATQLVPLLASAAPGLSQLLRKLQAHWSAGKESAEARSYVNDVWSRYLRGELPPESLAREALVLQEEIYQRRRTAPEVPNWFYTIRRSNDELQMEKAASRMVDDILNVDTSASASSAPAALPEHDDGNSFSAAEGHTGAKVSVERIDR